MLATLGRGVALGKVTVHLAHLKGTDVEGPLSGRPSNRATVFQSWLGSEATFPAFTWRPRHCPSTSSHLQHVAFCPQDFELIQNAYPAQIDISTQEHTKTRSKGPSFYTILLPEKKIFLNGLPENFPYISLAKNTSKNAINIEYPGKKGKWRIL